MGGRALKGCTKPYLHFQNGRQGSKGLDQADDGQSAGLQVEREHQLVQVREVALHLHRFRVQERETAQRPVSAKRFCLCYL